MKIQIKVAIGIAVMGIVVSALAHNIMSAIWALAAGWWAYIYGLNDKKLTKAKELIRQLREEGK